MNILLTVLIAIGCFLFIANTVVADHKLYKAESKCIAKHVAKGVSRKDIYTDNGKCHVEILIRKKL